MEALTAPFADRIRLRTPVARASLRADDDVAVDGERFDHVVLATHADQTLRDPRRRRHARRSASCSAAFPYAPNEAVLHHDRRLLPRRRRAWASWNYHLLDAPTGKPTVTYHMNRLQSLRGAHRSGA